MQTMYKASLYISAYFVISAEIMLCANPFYHKRYFEKY